MKAAKNAKKSTVKRRKSKRKVIVKKPAQHQISQAPDTEGLLVGSLLNPSRELRDGIVIEDLIYSLTPKLARTAYRFGYSIGMDIFANSSKEQNMLVPVLGRLGFRNIVYQPFRDALVIKSGSRNHTVRKVDAKIHSFEAGIIAGYLSAHSGELINTTEKECIYNGDQACRFVSNTGRAFGSNSNPSLEDVIDTIAANMHEIKFSDRSEVAYHMLPLMPMTKQPLRNEVVKIFYLIGLELSQRYGKDEAEALLENIARYFGTSKGPTKISTKTAEVQLRYSYHNSNSAFVELSTAMVRGFIRGKTSKEPNVYINIDKNKNYVVDIATTVHK